MDSASIYYLGVTVGLFVIFALIVIRTFNKKRQETIEAPKHRMLDDE